MSEFSKKGQITMFIVIGLVLIFVVALYILSRKTVEKPHVSTHDFSAVTAIYEAGASNCLEFEGTNIFRKIMAQGGYLSPSESFVSVDDYTTIGSAVRVGDGVDDLLPYWFEQKGSATCRGGCPVKFNIPDLFDSEDGESISVEGEVEVELEKRLSTCLDKIVFPPDYEYKTLDDVKVDVTIGEGVVTYDLYQDLNITFLPDKSSTTFSHVSAKSNANIKGLYELGTDLLMQLEIYNTTQRLGKLTEQIVRINSLSGDIPPMDGGVSFATSGIDMWLLPDVKENVKNYLADSVPLLEVTGSSGEQILIDNNNTFNALIFTRGAFRPPFVFENEDLLANTEIDFYYDPSWDIDLKVSPSRGYLIQPRGGSFNIFGQRFGLFQYEFSYDLIYPVVVVLRDASAFDGRGVSLLYAVETGIKGNEPIGLSEAANYLENDDLVDVFSLEESRTDSNISIFARDNSTGEFIPDVDLEFSCGDVGISAGRTRFFEGEDDPKSVTSLPFCLGGFITGSKDNYYAKRTKLSVTGNEESEVVVDLFPIKDFDIEIKTALLGKNVFDNLGWVVGGDSLLGPDEEFNFILTLQTLPGEEEFIRAGQINMTSVSSQTIGLVPGVYSLEAYLVKYFGEDRTSEKFVIPEKIEDYDGEEITIPEIEFNKSILLGGVELIPERGLTFEITPDDYKKDTIVFNSLQIVLSDLTLAQDLEIMGEIGNYSALNYDRLKPVFK